MRISGVSVPDAIAGTASECLQHAVRTYSKNAVKTALMEFAELDNSTVSAWLVGDIRPSSRFTPILYVALSFLGYNVEEFNTLDNNRRTVLQAYALGGINTEELIDDLHRKRWSETWPLLLDVNQTSRDDKLAELAEEVEEKVEAESKLFGKLLTLHLLTLRDQQRLTKMGSAPAGHSASSPSAQAEDPRFASVAARQVATLLLTLAMRPDREQLIARTRHGHDLKELSLMIQEILEPAPVAEENNSAAPAVD